MWITDWGVGRHELHWDQQGIFSSSYKQQWEPPEVHMKEQSRIKVLRRRLSSLSMPPWPTQRGARFSPRNTRPRIGDEWRYLNDSSKEEYGIQRCHHRWCRTSRARLSRGPSTIPISHHTYRPEMNDKQNRLQQLISIVAKAKRIEARSAHLPPRIRWNQEGWTEEAK
jgi:hypothetical protein